MIKVSSYPIGNVTAPKRTKKASKNGDSGFAGMIASAEGNEDAPPTQATQATSSVNMLLGLQEISDEEVATKKAIKHGQMTLNALEELRMALLTGNLPENLLRNMEKLISEQREKLSDPNLQEVLDEIELRTAVELAKREML